MKLTPIIETRRQTGTALVMSLIFLLILTVLGVGALNTTVLQEKMAANSKEKNTAFQSAESALLTAENWISQQISKPIFPNEATGLYLPSTDGEPIWERSSLNWSGTVNLVVYPNTPTQTVSGGLSSVASQPKYIIEDLGEVPEVGGSKVLPGAYKGKGNTVLRITSHGTGGTNAAQARVQSTYARAY